jgi:hypothetical protein
MERLRWLPILFLTFPLVQVIEARMQDPLPLGSWRPRLKHGALAPEHRRLNYFE